MSADASDSLSVAIDKLGLQLDAEQLQMTNQYCQKLWAWNARLNLTRHTNYDLFVRRDLLDSMRLAALIERDEEILDVGTGGGVPGILLAILRPDLTVSVCDSIAKKSKAVQSMINELELPVAVHAAPVQDVLEDLRFHSLVTRAVGSLSQLLRWVNEYWLSFDRLLTIKGPRWVDERGEARHRGLLANLELRVVDNYRMPQTESDAVILQIRRRTPATN